MDELSAAIPPREPGTAIPLTAMQLRIWNALKTGGSMLSTRQCISVVELLGPLDLNLLTSCLDELVNRHESLRTTLGEGIDGSLEQRIGVPGRVNLDVVNLAELSSLEAQSALCRKCDEFSREEVDIRCGPLFAVRLYRRSHRHHYLTCALDHLISDGASLNVLDRDLWSLYRQGSRGSPIALPSLPIQFGDYALWQNRTSASWLATHRTYWEEHLRGALPVQVPERSIGSLAETRGAQVAQFQLGDDLTILLRNTALREKSLLPLVMLTIYIVVAFRWSRQGDLVLTFVSNARYRPELHSMIGFLANQLHLRIKIEKSDTFLGLLQQVKREFLSALSHEDMDRVPDFLPEWSGWDPGLHFNWLPRHGVQQRSIYGNSVESPLQVRPVPFKTVLEAVFIPLFADEPDGICLIVNYTPSAVPLDLVNEFAAQIRAVAEELVADIGAPVSA